MPANHGPVKAGLSVVALHANINTSLQQKFDHIVAAIAAGPEEASTKLLHCGARLQAAVGVEIVLHKIESSQSGCRLQVQGRAALGEKPGSLRLSIGQA